VSSPANWHYFGEPARLTGKVRLAILLIALHLLLSACSVQSPRKASARSAGEAGGAGSAVAVALRPPIRADQNQSDASPEALRHFGRANLAIEQEDWSTALAELEWLLENYPGLSGPCLNMALVYQYRGERELAEQYYQLAIHINPNNLAAYNQYAVFLREQGRFPEAKQVYGDALGVWEAHPQTHLNIGILYDLYMGDRGRALQHFNRYQNLTGSEDQLVAGWIVDLERQSMMLVKGN
jgi:Tfp pilus assembly protein PilF